MTDNPYSPPTPERRTHRSWPRCMALRIFTAFLVVLIVFPVCYYAWFLTFEHLVPPEFGMPTYEEEIELAFLVGSIAFSLVPLFVSIRVCGFLNRHLGSDAPKL